MKLVKVAVPFGYRTMHNSLIQYISNQGFIKGVIETSKAATIKKNKNLYGNIQKSEALKSERRTSDQ